MKNLDTYSGDLMQYSALSNLTRQRGFEEVTSAHLKRTDVGTLLPIRSDNRSAGYDFYSKDEKTIIKAGNKHTFWTDVKAYMLEDEVLELHVRSSIGTKLDVTLANTTGIIDSSYYSNESNDGNIGICLKNNSDVDVIINKNDRIAQGIFQKYLVVDNDTNLNKKRTGGFGSSGH